MANEQNENQENINSIKITGAKNTAVSPSFKQVHRELSAF